MVLQGVMLPRLEPGVHITATEVDEALESAAPDPIASVVRVEVEYHEPKNKEYRDLWIVGLNDAGLCFRFEEWPFWPPDQQGAAATGAV